MCYTGIRYAGNHIYIYVISFSKKLTASVSHLFYVNTFINC